MTHVALSQGAADFILQNIQAQKFRSWVQTSAFPDEYFWATLNFNPQLGMPGAYIGNFLSLLPLSLCFNIHKLLSHTLSHTALTYFLFSFFRMIFFLVFSYLILNVFCFITCTSLLLYSMSTTNVCLYTEHNSNGVIFQGM